ncbi:MAG TPA: farnesyl diphosphate synthase [Gemmataceae bacterium]|nr:farnesyl diphosphate synthase [Gemmataceae bacterium]
MILTSDLSQYLSEKRVLVEEHLKAALLRERAAPAALLEALRYTLLAPGKRLRPLLVIMAAEAFDGHDKDALPAACAVEMVHTYSLIHDDLPAMDDDDLRRGLPTCHKKFGDAMAILAGDALLTLAFEVLASSYSPRSATACCRELAVGAGAVGMVGGQVEDLACERAANDSVRRVQSLEVLENIHARKTGALFRACLRLGAWAARGEDANGPASALLSELDAYGRCFGQAFQITDDLLDVEGDAGQTGKRVQKDAVRGKLTYPGLLGIEESRRRAERLCEEACGHLADFGSAGERLAGLARSILERKR